MSTLHVLSHSPFGDNRLASCLRLLGNQDALLLCGDATYALQPGSPPFEVLQAAGVNLFVLAEDLQARALDTPDWAEAINYSGFVELSIEHDKVNTWL
ncbi:MULTISPECIES: sulfurtransferase complex subunit TusB [Pseudomonas]|jgi:tRNA 2-thiouridine synthesizing protein B|uniref:Sulfurtransferase complex subunit TusB n=1 Tax=Pseudomonas bijieensis TaxID=2681983 RepID=A0A6N1CMQ8_9PSED|nr:MULTISPECIES: sulfurtransferase complex subunit TusB [Pseudomonas]AXP03994.1 sulfurtransferase complex subunit TusB [Pseudomonas fluorescens]MCD9113702.1 sulfurtransferase complex subunit TusB [Pseudomonas bijieensis]PWJ31596.1 tRNA 2-thiouridine synthesizing protein B [Pseudomonas sp. 43mfcvi1.1]QIB07926.1 sulfurtransferase complex subunit TusB [Pseudomonas fluorescens]QKS85760.1 sulfurtransferase complex subunit TusB [Pseudomonas bijieensis]